MAFTKVHHVGMVARDLEEARRLYCDGFGLRVDEYRSLLPDGRLDEQWGANVLEFPIGEMSIWVMKPTASNTAAGRFLAARGGVGAMHHLAVQSDDIGRDVSTLESKGLRKMAPPQTVWNGKGPLFFQPATTLGLVLSVWPDERYFPNPAYAGEGIFTGMGHVGMVASDTEEARRFWGDVWGLTQDHSKTRAASDNVRIIEFIIGGSIIEISVPQDTVSGTARFLAQRGSLGATFHHICPWAPDVHRAVERGKAIGLQQIGDIAPREVSRRATAWFHPRSCLGTLMEIWNRPANEQQAREERR